MFPGSPEDANPPSSVYCIISMSLRTSDKLGGTVTATCAEHNTIPRNERRTSTPAPDSCAKESAIRLTLRLPSHIPYACWSTERSLFFPMRRRIEFHGRIDRAVDQHSIDAHRRSKLQYSWSTPYTWIALPLLGGYIISFRPCCLLFRGFRTGRAGAQMDGI